MNRWLDAEIYLIHFGHGLLLLVVLVIVAARIPWRALLAGSPLTPFFTAFWLYEAQIVLPAANRLPRGASALTGERMMTTTTTAPRGDEAARRDAGKIEDDEEMRGNRWQI